MSLELELLQAFEQLLKRDPNTFVCTVISVDKTKGTCVVEDEDGLEFINVRMSAIIDPVNKTQLLFPAIGSTILVGMIADDIHNLFVVAISELESYQLKVGLTEINIDKEGIEIKKGVESLKALLNELIDEVSLINPSTPANAPKLTILKQRLNTVLK